MKKILYIVLLIVSSAYSQGFDALLIASQAQFANEGGGGTSLNVTGLVSLFDNTTIDTGATVEGNAVTYWNDAEGTNNATGGVSPELHINSADSGKEVTFNGTDWLSVGAPTNLNFVPQTDVFSFVISLGETTLSQNGGVIFSKGNTASSGNKQWQISYVDDTGPNMQWKISIGGTSQNFYATGQPPQARALLVITVSTTQITVRVNGLQISTPKAIGTYNNATDPIIIGGVNTNGSGAANLWQGDINFIAVYNKVLSAGEISAIETEFNVN